MLPQARTPQKRMLPERMLITRLITSIGLALLLAIGIAAANHPEAVEHSAPALTSAAVLADPHANVLGAPIHPSMAMDAGTDSVVPVGAALCLLGVLCGLVFFALIRTSWQRHTQRLITVRSRIPSPFVMAAVVPRSLALALSQMGLSRT